MIILAGTTLGNSAKLHLLCIRECTYQFKVLPGAVENSKTDLVSQRPRASVLSSTENFKAFQVLVQQKNLMSVLALHAGLGLSNVVF